MPLREATLETFRDRARQLAEQFARHAARYRGPAYNEETARSEFISPFFEALGWDVANRQGHAPQYREVVHEEGVKVGDATKAPDYTFRIGGQRKFFVEAKKPGVDLKHDPAPAYQLRRYAWSAKLPLSILTDFDELAVYDTRIRPFEGDKASLGRILYFEHTEYVDRTEEIWNVFAKSAVLQGSFDAYAEDNKRKRGTSEVDGEFLKEIEGWREELAKNIALRNEGLSVDELNYAVQATIDRILFLRIAEGRGAEEYARLQALTNGPNIYARLLQLFRQADDRYNSGVFDFKADKLTPDLAIDDKVLKPILSALYYPQSPYEFSVLPAEILGNVYEQFLGKVIRLTPSGRAKVEEKPEVKKAGGVYYTPSYIVDYIVAHTVGKLVEGKTPKEMARLKIVDPACGSGSFLLAAYQKLLDAHLAWYREHEPRKHKEAVFEGPGGEWRLTTAKKREILLDSIHGVDIDRQAVEVTKLSLLLKCLEGETNETLRQLNLYGERALPSLEKNIQCGNSLISPQALLAHTGGLFPDDEELRRINPFDWQEAFPGIFRSGGFDAVLGNPPYIRIQLMTEWAPLETKLFKRNYRAAVSGNYDIYVVFIERAYGLLNGEGILGFIVPSKFFATDYGESLRSLLSERAAVSEVVDFGHEQVFDQATTYTCLLFLGPGRTKSIEVSKSSPREIKLGLPSLPVQLDSKYLSSGPWTFAGKSETGLLAKLRSCGERLGESAKISRGSSSGADQVFMVRSEGSGYSTKAGINVSLEPELLRIPVFATDFRRYQFAPAGNLRILFPYMLEDGKYRLLDERTLRANFPKAFRYLSSEAKTLESRKQYSAWYSFSAPRNLELHDLADYLVPLLANRGAFCALPESSTPYCLMASGGFSISLDSSAKRNRLALLALLNSKLAFWFLKQISNRFRGGWITCTKQYVEQIPIPAAPVPTLHSLGHLGEQAIAAAAAVARATNKPSLQAAQGHQSAVEAMIDRLVFELYELTPEEIAIVEKG